MTTAERLKIAYEFLKEKAVVQSQEELAQMMQTSKANVSKALSGDPKVLTTNFVVRFREYTGNRFSLGWLLEGEGDMLITTEEEDGDCFEQLTDHQLLVRILRELRLLRKGMQNKQNKQNKQSETT